MTLASLSSSSSGSDCSAETLQDSSAVAVLPDEERQRTLRESLDDVINFQAERALAFHVDLTPEQRPVLAVIRRRAFHALGAPEVNRALPQHRVTSNDQEV
eukprot:CAMPEP_0171127978 /NCGR_PEP_ID=MMETSP0766_2-20121228/116223_1 /TAXON_ID=439317 /ORGANISM="Gambierdiscus australes, Strain CAWD 149" /LENGTH=100 /DNA_ID=CAMNT_0011591109 /DNA_START=53 /DNA_END=350 /DNA_ORIENTATION=-